MNLVEAMESVPRCILMYEPERDCWAATDIEWSDLRWHANAALALAEFLHGEAHMGSFAYDFTEKEDGIAEEIRAAGKPWACEWWHGPNGEGAGEWLRPFAVGTPA